MLLRVSIYARVSTSETTLLRVSPDTSGSTTIRASVQQRDSNATRTTIRGLSTRKVCRLREEGVSAYRISSSPTRTAQIQRTSPGRAIRTLSTGHFVACA
eukprot:2608472-Rhodomonas_salina.1